MKTKIELINRAFVELRISGITSPAANEDNELALEELEDFMRSSEIKLPYNFEKVPDPNTESGIPDYANRAVQLSLAIKLAPAFNKIPDQFLRQASAAWSKLLNRMASPRQTLPSGRMPLGRGNERYRGTRDFMPPPVVYPPQANMIGLADAVKIQEDFSDYMQPGETVSTYEFTADAGLQVTANSLLENVITLMVEANGSPSGFYSSGLLRIKIKVVGTSGTERNRYVYFVLSDSLPVTP